MEELNQFIKGSVICNLESTEKFDAIHELIQKAPIFKCVTNPAEIETAVIHREILESTGLGKGIAVAHGKCPEVGNVLVALGISKQGVEFDSRDGDPVHFLFLVANHPEAWNDYLATLSSLIQVMKNSQFRKKLLQKKEPDSIERLLHRKIHRLLKHH